MQKPLQDLRIVSIEQFGAGPWATLQLSDLGADVIKIEEPRTGGDVSRYVPPYNEGEDSLFFETFNRGKRSISLDIRAPAGRRVFEDLVPHADVVFSNLRGDVPAKLGITYDDLKHLNQQIVCCSLSAFGTTGPRAAEPSYDYILQAMAGWMQFTGEPGSPPTRSGPSVVDYSTGFVAATSMLAAVHAARRDGVGANCDVSLFDTAVSLLAYLGTWSLNTDYEAEKMRNSAHPTMVPFQAFEAADGWLVVGCGKEQFFRRLVGVLGQPQLADEEGFGSLAERDVGREQVLARIEPLFKAQTVEHWMAELRAAGVPAGPVQGVRQAMDDEQTRARGMVLEYDHPRFGATRTLSSPVQVGEAVPSSRRAPLRGEHREEILTDLLGYDDETAREVAEAHAFGEQP